MPPPIMAMPAAITSLAAPRVTSAWDRPAKATELSAITSQASPAFSAEYPSTCCMYRVPTKMNAKKLPPSSTPTAFAPASVLQPEDPQRHQRRLDARLGDHEGGEQGGGHREQRQRSGGAPPGLRGGRDRVDQQRQAAGHGNRAEGS
jgi:hypothetical protein